MTRPPFYLVACAALALFGCTSPSSRVSSQPVLVLSAYRKVAVVSMEVTIIRNRMEKSETGNRLGKYIALADEYIFRRFREAFGKDTRIGAGRLEDPRDPKANLEDLAIEIVNRNLLEKGFLPVERQQMKLILRELSRSQTGLFDPGTRQEIGRLAAVDALYHGRILVGVEQGLFSLKTRVTFNGRIISVGEGYVLVAGESTIVDDEFKPEHIRQTIDGWFEDVSGI